MRLLRTFGRVTCGIAASLVLAAGAFGQPPSGPASAKTVRQLHITNKPQTGDFDRMLERRIIRVLVPYSRSLYFNDNGRERGISAENARDFEHWINRKYAKKLGKRPLTVFIIPTTRDKLLPEVVQGLGDIAVANLTVTKERLKSVDFASPAAHPAVKELIVTGPKSPQIVSTGDLAGKTVHVRKTSSYYESLTALNGRFRKEGKPAVKLVLVPDALEDEDMMEMLNAGLLEAIVVDDWKAKMWAQILPKIRVNEHAVVRESGKLGWAIRKRSPKLEAEILGFYQGHLRQQGVAAYRLKRYMSRVRQIKNPTGASEWERFEKTLALFRKYGQKYSFDPLMLVAQGYQESRLNQEAKSPVGAIGIMQVMPATGKQLKVGNIRVTEPNIHAGTKYLDQLLTNYFPDAHFTGNNRTLFAFASYNCGPGNVSKMRREAAKRGLNPDEWFNNVEIVTAEKIGMETTTYVRNIYKYYVAYKLQLEVQERARNARKHVAPGTGN
ncbi:MAG: transporter substrate-binding domain-containing protein [Deltaproteobacteria bacterium]|nr:transporter substrate-binding domain-containing protein [Deltaproteobacteria bacterium]